MALIPTVNENPGFPVPHPSLVNLVSCLVRLTEVSSSLCVAKEVLVLWDVRGIEGIARVKSVWEVLV